MAKPSIWGKKFNRDDDFVAQKKMLVSGVTVLPGQPIDKTKFTTRRLRCLYDWRWIRVDETAYLLRSPANYARLLESVTPDLEMVEIDPASEIIIHATPGEIVKVGPKKRGRPRKSVAA